jgi:hypothetical protein
VVESRKALRAAVPLTCRWNDLFNAKFEVLLYNLTSNYFQSDPPFPEGDKRRFGYSRDKRSDCVQVVIALIVTPEGFPLAYEVLSGNTADKTTLRGFLQKFKAQYGKAERVWVMDRGIPTEEVLAEMSASDPPVRYLVGTSKGRLSQLEEKLTALPWQNARAGVDVKLLPEEGEFYVLAQSQDRISKERAMHRRQFKWFWKRLGELKNMELKRGALLLKLGAAQQRAPTDWRLVQVEVEAAPSAAQLQYLLRKDKLRAVRKAVGRYLLRTNLPESDPARLREF